MYEWCNKFIEVWGGGKDRVTRYSEAEVGGPVITPKRTRGTGEEEQ